MERPSGCWKKEKKRPKHGECKGKGKSEGEGEGEGEGKEQQPVKVVYIANPTKVNASVHEFRSVVQELTGQDSGEANLAKYGEGSNEGSAGGDLPVPSAVETPSQTNPSGADLRNDYELDEYLADVPEMLDGFGSSFS